jgi:hypothetical protein
MHATELSLAGGPSPQMKGGAVNFKDQKNQARKIVSERLRSFFSQLQEKLAASTGELWKRAENQAEREREESGHKPGW